MITRKAEILVALGKAGSLTAAEEGLLDMVHPMAEAAVMDYMQIDLALAQHVEYLPIGGPVDEPDLLSQVDFRGSSAILTSGRAGTDFLQLKHTPVWLAGLEVREDVGANAGQASGSFGSTTVLTLGTDYFLDVDDPSQVDATGVSPAVNGISRTGILRRFGDWPTEPRSVKVTYYGGHSISQLSRGASGAIRLAIIRTVCQMFWGMKASQDSEGAGPKVSENMGHYSYSLGSAGAAGLGAGAAIPADAKQLLQPHRNFGRIFATG